ncbi:hypothetical protein EC991_004638 [Linnemannia zychae]|nr:hypothetical protein EC991_004638 [Linnemannia zychae]
MRRVGKEKTVKGITGSSGAPNPSGRNIVNEAMGNAASNGAEDGDEEVLTPEEEEAVEEAVTAVVSAGAEQEEGEYDDDSVGEEGEPKIFMTSATLSKSSASASSPSHSRGGAVVV